MLDEDGVAGQVAMDDGRFTGVQVAGDKKTRLKSRKNCHHIREQITFLVK